MRGYKSTGPKAKPGVMVQHELYVGICGDVIVGQANAKQALEECASTVDPSMGVALAPVETLPASLDAVERITNPGQKPPLDLLIIDADLPGLSGISLVREIRAIDRYVRIVMTAHDGDQAYDALTLGVDAYLLKPVSNDAFCKALLELLTETAAQRAETVVVNFRDRVRRVAKRDIVYAETVDHDQVVHFRDGGECAIRCSSQALFDLLASDAANAADATDERFFKAGSSFIVNLSYVRSFGKDGVAQLAGGATVTVPVRLRNVFAEALMSFGM